MREPSVLLDKLGEVVEPGCYVARISSALRGSRDWRETRILHEAEDTEDLSEDMVSRGAYQLRE